MICDYQINLENATNLSSSVLGVGDIQYFWKGGEPYIGGLGILLGDLITT